MKRVRPALLIVFALSPVAAAQTGGWHIELSNPVLSPSQPSTQVRLLAWFPPEFYAFGASLWSIHATEPGWSDPLVLLPPPSNAGNIEGPSILGITSGQIHFPPVIFANPANPIAVYEATWTATNFEPRDLDITTATTRFDVYHPSTSPHPPTIRFVEEGMARITIIPAPATIALTAVAALTAIRRQRRSAQFVGASY